VVGYECGVDVLSTRDTVWRLLTDGPGYPGWNRAVVHLAGPIQDGGQVVATLVDGSRVRFSVREVEEESRMVWRRSVLPGLLSESLVFLLGDSVDGVRTEVTQEVHGPLARVFGVGVPRRDVVLSTFLAGLKTQAEGVSRGSPG
jgi:hypothetical protein